MLLLKIMTKAEMPRRSRLKFLLKMVQPTNLSRGAQAMNKSMPRNQSRNGASSSGFDVEKFI
uniref:Uncharacterized protein n=1 Tax=Arundo donax TaxID=35708 RepID=A0A0A9E816_ARUDO